MVDSTLKNYIKNTLKQGYKIDAIRTRLKQSGYSSSEINQAVKQAKGRKIISTKTLLIAAILIIFLIILVIISLKLIVPTPKQISISTTPLVSTVTPGGKLVFVTTLTSPINRKITATLKHRLINKKTNKIITTQTETIPIGTKSSTQTQIIIPENSATGECEVITDLTSENNQKQARFTFIIQQTSYPTTPLYEQPTTQTLLCPQGCDDYNACTKDECINGICKHTPITPCCGNRICEQGEDIYNCAIDCKKEIETNTETITKAVKKAKTDPETASMLCNSLPSVDDANECFEILAKESGKNQFCESIQDTELESNCLLNFALKGDYSVCDKINDPYYIQSCYSLQRQSEMQSLAIQFS
ncbi:hypothetical protein KY304_00405 [Candidatus Woesearchaeota archaeon]|nr:hypothetical protein [Candidatus Woesearchaeota archaeon]MBW2978556.1 hypothetical protein [Candidatus Woesearchaeota archaeon]